MIEHIENKRPAGQPLSDPPGPIGKSAEISGPGPSARAQLSSGRSLGQILIVLVVLLALVNIPINAYGLGLAHLKPEATPLILYEGLLLRGRDSGAVYRLEDHKLRPVSPEALAAYFNPNQVRTVEDDLLAQFGRGQPIRYLVRCSVQAQIYAVEDGHKYPQAPPTTNQAWDRIHWVSCKYLESLPDGSPIPN